MPGLKLQVTLVFLSLLFVITACSDQSEIEAQQAVTLSKAQYMSLYQSAKTAIVDDASPEALQRLADVFMSIFHQTDTTQNYDINHEQVQVKEQLRAASPLFNNSSVEPENAAAKELKERRRELLLYFWYSLFLSFDALYEIDVLSTHSLDGHSSAEADRQFDAQQKALDEINASLEPLLLPDGKNAPHLLHLPVLYDLDANKGLLAFSRKRNGARYFISLNLSFDGHEMPLPLGFMSSTKITLWQKDLESTDKQARIFVSDGPPSMRPFSFNLLAVGLK
uniref:hypothetical protein n=1 Tax=Ningiella ruwaisensis TaxID=2364274 RepID=UPI00109FD453|nr:hypothetical protein [Ningiella ruwaisensis]